MTDDKQPPTVALEKVWRESGTTVDLIEETEEDTDYLKKQGILREQNDLIRRKDVIEMLEDALVKRAIEEGRVDCEKTFEKLRKEIVEIIEKLKEDGEN